MNNLIFYDKYGNRILWLSDKDNETLYDFSGNAVAYIYGNSIYSFKGKHLGFYENGWVLNSNGYYVLFTQEATGGIVRPVKKISPIIGIARTKPIKMTKSIKPVKPVKKLQWSDADYFLNN